MRTTIDIDDVVLKDLKRLQQREGKSLGRLVSDLLAGAIATAGRDPHGPAPSFTWTSKAMGRRIDIDDKDALRDAMDEPLP